MWGLCAKEWGRGGGQQVYANQHQKNTTFGIMAGQYFSPHTFSLLHLQADTTQESCVCCEEEKETSVYQLVWSDQTPLPSSS